MKILNTLHDLWGYCLFCPICQDYCRDIDITVGPDFVFILDSFIKENNILYLNCSFKRKNQIKYKITYTIDTLTNSLKVDIKENPEFNLSAELAGDTPETASKSYFFFYLHGNCAKCNASHCNSSDIELNMLKNNIYNIGVEREGIRLIQHKDKYSITIAYDSNNMLISKLFKCFENLDESLITDDKIFECPIVDFDFSDQARVISKIKTLMIFS